MKDYQTSDLALAAYLMMKGLILKSATKGPTGRFEFIFKDPKDEALQHSLEYVNSDCCKFDSHVRNLKNIIYKK